MVRGRLGMNFKDLPVFENLNANCRLAILLCSMFGPLAAQPTLVITAPSNGATVVAGQALAVTVVASPVGAIQAVWLGGTNGVGVQVLNSPPFQFSFAIPSDTRPGHVFLTAIGALGPNQPIYSPQLDIIVTPPTDLTLLIAEPNILQLTLSEKGYLRAVGLLANGTQTDLSQSPSTTFSTSGAVATVSKYGIVTPVAPGSDMITVTYGSLSVSVPITVRPPLTVLPPRIGAYASQTREFLAKTTSLTPPSITWSISPAGMGSINGAGTYTAPSSISTQQTVTVTAVNSVDNSTASAIILLYPALSVAVSPATATLTASQTQLFTPILTGAFNPQVQWSASPPGVGNVDRMGLYTAPSSVTGQQTVIVTATSVVDLTKSASATVTLGSKTTPTIKWINPADLLSGTALGVAQLNAVASVPGTFLYTPPAGTVLPVGSGQTLQVLFTPTDAANYNSASGTVLINVNAAVVISVSPATSTLVARQTKQFIATVSNAANTAVTWTFSPSMGTLSAGGLYTAPSSITIPQTIIVSATSVADPTKAATASIVLYPPVANLSISPSSQNLFASGTQQFTALSGGIATSNVTWGVNSAVGTVNNSGLYTAPAAIPSQTTVTLTAKSTIDSSKSATATITLAPLSMSISPSSANLSSNQMQQFTAAVNHNPITAVTWSVVGLGTINSAGVYSAPSAVVSNTTVVVKATSVADPTKFITSTVSLRP